MASTLVVLAANGRRANTKANPNTALSEVLQSACKSLRLNADQYALKHNGKSLDLSLTFRLSGLPNHTQLELVQASRSPSVVSVALQLPPSSDGSGSHASRLTGKFASSTSIWQILRQFESGAAATTTTNSAAAASSSSSSSSSLPPSSSLPSSSPTYNFTERAVPIMAAGGPATTVTATAASAGAGRLCYQAPVVDFMGRELAGVEELQKTLAQLGLSGGSALLRLSFRQTEQPLEDAIATISHFFKSDTRGIDKDKGNGVANTSTGSVNEMDLSVSPDTAHGIARMGDVDMNNEITTSKDGGMSDEMPSQIQTESQPVTKPSQPPPQSSSSSSALAADSTLVDSHDRALSIFAPPINHTPQAATFTHNPDDYETTIESARIHQSRLAASSRNKRLLSDKEIDELEKAKKEKVEAVREVVIRVRLPDQSQVQSKFTKDDEASSLYAFVRNLIDNEDQPFTLRYTGEKGTQIIIKDGQQLLTKDLMFQGRVLVSFLWNDTVPLEIRQKSILKPTYQEQAKNIKVEAPQSIQKPIDGEAQDQGKIASSNSVSEENRNQSKEQRMKRFLGKLTRK